VTVEIIQVERTSCGLESWLNDLHASFILINLVLCLKYSLNKESFIHIRLSFPSRSPPPRELGFKCWIRTSPSKVTERVWLLLYSEVQPKVFEKEAWHIQYCAPEFCHRFLLEMDKAVTLNAPMIN